MQQAVERPFQPAPADATSTETRPGERVIEGVALSVVPLSPHLEQVTLDGWPIGYIEHVAPVFVALSGPRRDRAVECGQSPDRDQALVDLIRAAIHRA